MKSEIRVDIVLEGWAAGGCDLALGVGLQYLATAAKISSGFDPSEVLSVLVTDDPGETVTSFSAFPAASHAVQSDRPTARAATS